MCSNLVTGLLSPRMALTRCKMPSSRSGCSPGWRVEGGFSYYFFEIRVDPGHAIFLSFSCYEFDYTHALVLPVISTCVVKFVASE
jgi:hypothetical protein